MTNGSSRIILPTSSLNISFVNIGLICPHAVSQAEAGLEVLVFQSKKK